MLNFGNAITEGEDSGNVLRGLFRSHCAWFLRKVLWPTSLLCQIKGFMSILDRTSLNNMTIMD